MIQQRLLTLRKTSSSVVCCSDQCSNFYFYIVFIPYSSSFYLNLKLTSYPVSAFMPVITYPCPNSFFSYKVVPFATIRPLLIIKILSDRHQDYSMLWVVISIVRLLSLSFRIIFQVYSLILASMPVVGSSNTTSLGFPIKLIANDNLLLIPPEKVFTFPVRFS